MRSYFTNRKNRVSYRISQETIGTRPREVVRRDRPSAPFSHVFQNDLHLSTDENRLLMCADDHQLFSVAKTTNEAESILTEEGNKISEWYSNNFLQGNFFKNQVTSLGPRSCHKDLHIVINDTVIDQKPEITPLGVTLDDQLSFSSYVSNDCRKASSQTGILLGLRNLIPTSAN